MVNEALERSDAGATMRALQNPKLEIASLFAGAQTLYHEELRTMKAEKQVCYSLLLYALPSMAVIFNLMDLSEYCLTFQISL